jgi:hypothetical protein
MRLLKYAVLLLASFIWLAGVSPGLFEFLGKHKLIKDGYQFGDLFRMANLSEFKVKYEPCPQLEPVVRHQRSKKVNLFIIGDSFTEPERVKTSNYAADLVTYSNWNYLLHLKIDTTATNILLLECVERHFRQKFSAPLSKIIPDTATYIEKGGPRSFVQRLDDAFGSKGVEGRLDMLLFQNDLVMYLKQWKADFNYRFFDRVSNEVRMVNQNQNIVFYMDVDTPQTTSSFSELDDAEVDSIVENLEKSKEIAQNMGFDGVILSAIPNKVSVIMPEYGTYNRLIERVYGHPGLTIPKVDVLQDFRKMGTTSYLKSDSHWSCDAQNHWLYKTNLLINQVVAQH